MRLLSEKCVVALSDLEIRMRIALIINKKVRGHPWADSITSRIST